MKEIKISGSVPIYSVCLPNKKILIIQIGSATISNQHHNDVGKDWMMDDEQWRIAA
jgi:hypothetical protein